MTTLHFQNTLPEVTLPIQLSGFQFKVRAMLPDIGEGQWHHGDMQKEDKLLGGSNGTLSRTTWKRTGGEVELAYWRAADGKTTAIQLSMQNTSDRDIVASDLVPVQCVLSQTLSESCPPIDQWRVLRQAAMKNDVPTALRPGVMDEDYCQAIAGATEQGDLVDQSDVTSQPIRCNPFVAIDVGDGNEKYLIGLLGQVDHLGELVLTSNVGTGEIELKAHCYFDSVAIPAGEWRHSDWVLFSAGHETGQLIDAYVQSVKSHHAVAEPSSKPPSVYCSWYYYGLDFTQADLEENLNVLDRQRIPFDVLLIDDAWSQAWGEWYPNSHWPDGMKQASDAIRQRGYRPGIWTCPFLANANGRLTAEHPDWFVRRDDGDAVIFHMAGTQNRVLDPTHPDVQAWLEATYKRITEEYGFTYHKIDFARAVVMDDSARFSDPTATRLQAYRLGLQAIRRGIGNDSYLSVCGGHYGGSIGLADSQRSGSDTQASWADPPALPKIKQNVLRTWMGPLWHTDPDAVALRRRETHYTPLPRLHRLSTGKFSDEEAVTLLVNQYIGGGIVCFAERLSEIDADRLQLYRRVIPNLGIAGKPLDWFEAQCPSRFVHHVEPRGKGLQPWTTLTLCNWSDEASDLTVTLGKSCLPEKITEVFAFELMEQKALGVVHLGDTLVLQQLPAHASRMIRLAPWDGKTPVLAGTDLHFSGGGLEIDEWRADAREVTGMLDTEWRVPVTITVAAPSSTPQGFELHQQTIMPSTNRTTFQVQHQ